NTTTTQTAAKAVDGSPTGYPTDYTKEWSTVGGKAGSWLQLTWATPVTLSRVVLYDRPNTSDQITAGTLLFSDGTTAPVTSLTNAGTATTITFTPRTVTSVRLQITTVSSTTANVGLAEIEAWGYSAS
ncbi:MAG TPA: discoidin domain-containing protein, partial [Dermatophilaceae bacterium]|nr:discoidin domain-containing protein [Dermatophilaceae bacterium]